MGIDSLLEPASSGELGELQKKQVSFLSPGGCCLVKSCKFMGYFFPL